MRVKRHAMSSCRRCRQQRANADNRIGDQVKTVCVVRGNQLYKREDRGDGEGEVSWGRTFHFPTHEAASEQGDPGNVGLVAERVRKSKRPLEMIALLHKSPLHAGCDQLPLSRISQVEWKHSLRSITQINSDACASMHRHVGLEIGPDCRPLGAYSMFNFQCLGTLPWTKGAIDFHQAHSDWQQIRAGICSRQSVMPRFNLLRTLEAKHRRSWEPLAAEVQRATATTMLHLRTSMPVDRLSYPEAQM